MAKRFYSNSEIQKMHETGEYPDTDMSDEDLDDSDADPHYQTELETNDSDSEDSIVPVSALTPKLQRKRNRVTSRSPSPQPKRRQSTSRSLSPQPSTSRRINRSPSLQPTRHQGTSRSPSPQQNIDIASQSASRQPANNVFDNIVWTDPIGNQKVFQFTGSRGMDPNISGIMALADPIDYFQLFLTPQVLDEMVNETNLYATQILEKTNVGPNSRLHDWTPTDRKEMTKFIALLGWMGLVKVPKLADYWRRSELYAIPLPKNTMSRNRFELLLRFWHFANNEEAERNNRLSKVEKIIQMFVNSYQSTYTPAEKICIDETMVPWRGRLSFRQYIPSKRHRYGIKIYKLCSDKGYTWNLSVYIGNDRTDDLEASASQNVVMKLIRDLLDNGRKHCISTTFIQVCLWLVNCSLITHTL